MGERSRPGARAPSRRRPWIVAGVGLIGLAALIIAARAGLPAQDDAEPAATPTPSSAARDSAPSARQTRPTPDLSQVQDLVSLSGECTELIIAGVATPGCVGEITSSSHQTGRSGFIFIAANEALVTFSGISAAALRDGDTVVRPLDLVIFARVRTGEPPTPVEAVGSCRHANPEGAGRVTCSAQTSLGAFKASFRTNGDPPVSASAN